MAAPTVKESFDFVFQKALDWARQEWYTVTYMQVLYAGFLSLVFGLVLLFLIYIGI